MKNFIIKEFLYNGHLQSLGSVGIVLFVYFIFNLGSSFPFALAISTYCIFQPIYYFDRYRDFRKDSLTNKERSAHIERHIRFFPIAIAFLIILYIFLAAANQNISAFLFGVIVMLAGLAYPLKAKSITKHIPLFKNIYVGGVHGILIIYPLLFLNISVQISTMIFLFLYIILEAMVSQIVLDTKDTSSDRKDKLKTLAVLIGESKSFKVARILSIVSFISSILLLVYLESSYIFFIIVLVTSIVSLTSIKYAANKSKIGYLLAASKFSLWIATFLSV